ncbi:MAG: hypothetical protein HY730_04475 [Candidatus Tectomicrobia bacterium]|uniref:Amidohydrolase n=1 Tax=Tectimicrobiota bacterium TaxID=2528274 RepID=A0A933LPY8_UNCTE|nr:hypothetical protein [Candidatus Tectomicrobia bacterium]
MEIKAIDIHVHPPTPEYLESQGKYLEATAKYFGIKIQSKSAEELPKNTGSLK